MGAKSLPVIRFTSFRSTKYVAGLMKMCLEIMTKMRQDADRYIWESLSSVEHPARSV